MRHHPAHPRPAPGRVQQKHRAAPPAGRRHRPGRAGLTQLLRVTAPAGLPLRRVRAVPLVLVASVFALDRIDCARDWPVPVVGLLDEPAHLATAWLALATVPAAATSRRVWLPALVAVCAIDLDHVPLYLSGGRFAVDGGRPPTHCLATAAILLLLRGAAGPRAQWALGGALGIVLHFVRDLATGPGVALLWPASAAEIRVPYGMYATALGGLALSLAVGRSRRH